MGQMRRDRALGAPDPLQTPGGGRYFSEVLMLPKVLLS